MYMYVYLYMCDMYLNTRFCFVLRFELFKITLLVYLPSAVAAIVVVVVVFVVVRLSAFQVGAKQNQQQQQELLHVPQTATIKQ